MPKIDTNEFRLTKQDIEGVKLTMHNYNPSVQVSSNEFRLNEQDIKGVKLTIHNLSVLSLFR